MAEAIARATAERSSLPAVRACSAEPDVQETRRARGDELPGGGGNREPKGKTAITQQKSARAHARALVSAFHNNCSPHDNTVTLQRPTKTRSSCSF